MANYSAVVVCILSLLVASACASSGPFNKHLRYVDHDVNTGNWLFRGGTPVDDGDFLQDALNRSMQAQALASNVTGFPTDYYLVVFSFLREDDEDFNVEKNYFLRHEDRGFYHSLPLNGMVKSQVVDGCKFLFKHDSEMKKECKSDQPDHYGHEEMSLLSRTWTDWGDSDGLPAWLSYVHQMLTETRLDKPLVLYGHCHCGCDRTGEFFASYMMRYKNHTFPEAMRWDEEIIDGHIKYQYQLMTQWYCKYLVHSGLAPAHTMHCGDCQSFRCHD